MAKTISKYSLFFYQVEAECGIYRAAFNDIYDQLSACVTTPPAETHIDIWLDSPGGSADAAYKIMLELRSRADTLWCFIPDYAKSAATLMALGMDRIYMGPSAELGPLDVQIQHPDRENVRVSGLDVVNSLAHITNAANDMVLSQGMKLIKYTQLTRAEVLREELAFMAQLLQPVVSKIDPSLLHQAANQLKVAQEYAERLLALRKVEGDYSLNQQHISNLCSRLVHRYPAHGFVISREEAASFGLPVYNAETHEHWNIGMKKLLEATEARTDTVEIYTHEEMQTPEASSEETGKAVVSGNGVAATA